MITRTTHTLLTMAFLLGALVASATLNVLHWTRCSAQTAATPSTAAAIGARHGTDAGAPSADARAARELLQCLELSPAQIEQLQDCCTDSCGVSCCGEATPTVAAELTLRDKMTELGRALAQPEADAAHVRRLARELADLRAASIVHCVESMLRVRDVLTKAQLTTITACFTRRE